MKGVLDIDRGPFTYAPARTRAKSPLLTSTEMAHHLGVRVTELDGIPSVVGPTGTRRYLVPECEHAPLTARDRRDVALVLTGAATALAALIIGAVR